MKSKDFKARAREALKGNWFVAIIAGLLASLLGAANGFTGGFSFNFSLPENPPADDSGVTALLSSMGQQDGGESYYGLLITLAMVYVIIFIAAIIQLIISSTVCVGYAQFNLDIADENEVKLKTMFSRVNQMGTAICAQLLYFVRVFIGLLFFLIPGIVMSYSYAMVNFVLADNPEMNARQALKESRRIMRGNRWKLFCLQMSFLGLAFLSILTLGIGLIWIVPYQQAAIAVFYREAKKNA